MLMPDRKDFPARRQLLPANTKLQEAYNEFCYWNTKGAHDDHTARADWAHALHAGARIAHYAFHVEQPQEVHDAADALMRFHDGGGMPVSAERALVYDLVEALERSTSRIEGKPPRVHPPHRDDQGYKSEPPMQDV